MIRACLTILAAVLIIGHLNAQDIKHCVSQGHSTDWCLAVFNP